MKVMILSNQARSMANFWSVLIRRLREYGHEVTACAPGGDGESALAALGVPLTTFPLDRKGLNPARDLASFAALRRIFAREKPDCLFATTIKPVIYGCLAARLARVPKIYATITGLGYAFEADTPLKKAVRSISSMLYRHALAGAAGVFFQNRDDVEVFKKNSILADSANILMARGTGVDTARFSPVPPPAGNPVFLLVARLLEAKGLREYAEASAMLRQRWPGARFQLLGPPEKGPGSISVEEVRRWSAVEYLGECRDVRPYIAQSHVVVLPSWREGTPTAVMEAMSMGRPCVACDSPGCREVVRDGFNGYLAPVRDAGALAGRMENFLLNPGLAAEMGARGRRMAVEEFDANHVAEGIIRDMGLGDGQ